MNKSFIKTITAKLLSEKEELQKKTVAVHFPEIDLDGDEVDEIQGKQLIELNKQLAIRNADKLSQIEEALKRIAENKYGQCSDCEENISEKRLIHNPYFLTCVSCAEDRETQQRKR